MSNRTLGCPLAYTCEVTYRGGSKVMGRLENTTNITWDRKLDGVGEATVTIATSAITARCCRMLREITQDEATRAYELHIWRDNVKVWCGPILTVTETHGTTLDQVVISARDILAYLDDYGHWLQHGYNITGDVVQIAVQVIGQDLLTDDPGIGRNMLFTNAGVTLTAAAAPYSGTVLAQMDALVPYGLRYTTAVRAFYLGGLRGTAFGAPIHLTLDDIAGDVSMVNNGAVFANTVYGSSGLASSQITAGVIPPADPQLVTVGGPEKGWRGRVEHGVSATGTTTGQSGVVAAAQAAYFAGLRPRVLRVADNAALSPQATVTVPQLVCGSVVKIAGDTRFCTWAPEDLQLVRVQGSFANAGETIGISLGPVA